MKNIKYLIILFALYINPVFAFQYTEQDKNMFYDAFLDGYLTEMSKSVDELNIEQSKKIKFMSEVKQQINKQELVNSSWTCIQKYPIEQIVSASVICTSDWTNKQAKKNKELFSMIK